MKTESLLLAYVCPRCGAEVDVWSEEFNIHCVFCGAEYLMIEH